MCEIHYDTTIVQIGEKFPNCLWVYKADLVQYSQIWWDSRGQKCDKTFQKQENEHVICCSPNTAVTLMGKYDMP